MPGPFVSEHGGFVSAAGEPDKAIANFFPCDCMEANKAAFIALPQLLAALEGEYNQLVYDRQFCDSVSVINHNKRIDAIKSALISAGYTFTTEQQ